MRSWLRILFFILISSCGSLNPKSRIVRYNNREIKVSVGANARVGWKYNLNDDGYNSQDVEIFDMFYCGYYDASILDTESSSGPLRGKFLTLAYELSGGEFVASHVKSLDKSVDLDVADNRFSRKIKAYRDKTTDVRYMEMERVTKEEDDIEISCKVNWVYRMTGERDQATGGNVKLIVNVPQFSTSDDPKQELNFWKPFGGGWIMVGAIILVTIVGGCIGVKVCKCHTRFCCLKFNKDYVPVATDEIDVESGGGKKDKVKRAAPAPPTRPAPPRPNKPAATGKNLKKPASKSTKSGGGSKRDLTEAKEGPTKRVKQADRTPVHMKKVRQPDENSKMEKVAPPAKKDTVDGQDPSIKKVKLKNGSTAWMKRVKQPDGTFKNVKVPPPKQADTVAKSTSKRPLAKSKSKETASVSASASSHSSGNKAPGPRKVKLADGKVATVKRDGSVVASKPKRPAAGAVKRSASKTDAAPGAKRPARPKAAAPSSAGTAAKGARPARPARAKAGGGVVKK